MEDKNEYMTPEEAAAKLRINVQTVRRHCRSGLGTLVGGVYRITSDDITRHFARDTDRGMVAGERR